MISPSSSSKKCQNCHSNNHSTEECSLCFNFSDIKKKRCKKCSGCTNSLKYYEKINKDKTDNFVEIQYNYSRMKEMIKKPFFDEETMIKFNERNDCIIQYITSFLSFLFKREEIDFWFSVYNIDEERHKELQREQQYRSFFVKNTIFEKLRNVITIDNDMIKKEPSTTDCLQLTFNHFCDIISCFCTTEEQAQSTKFITLDIKENVIKNSSIDNLDIKMREKLEMSFFYFKEKVCKSTVPEIQWYYENILKGCKSYRDIPFFFFE